MDSKRMDFDCSIVVHGYALIFSCILEESEPHLSLKLFAASKRFFHLPHSMPLQCFRVGIVQVICIDGFNKKNKKSDLDTSDPFLT